jgi:RNA methyltransferase, TrmH family
MLSHNQIKYINSLKIKKYRQASGSFLVEGEKCVAELLNSSLIVELIAATAEWIEQNTVLLRSLKDKIVEVDDSGLARISDLTTPNKVLAVVRIPQARPFLAQQPEKPVIALDEIRDPGNLGTIIRTADWFGISQIVCSPGCVDAYNPKTIMATMGSFTRVEIFTSDLADFVNNLQEGTPVYGAMLEGDDLNTIRFHKPGVLVIGSESHGLSDKVAGLLTHKIRIPTFNLSDIRSGNAESLNASIANAIICYELTKQLSKQIS